MKRLFQKPAHFTLLIFLLPLAFLSYYCDFHYGTVIGYAASALLLSLPWLLDRTLPAWVLLPAHSFSLLLSLYCNSLYGQTDRWVNYCKPLTVPQQFIFQHILYLLLGLLVAHLWQKKHK